MAATKFEIIRDETTRPDLRGWYVIENNGGFVDTHGPFETEGDAEEKLAELKAA